MSIQMSRFAKRQCNPDFKGTKVSPAIIEKLISLAESPQKVCQGYAPFCEIRTLSNRGDDKKFLFEDLNCLIVDKKKALQQGATLHTAYEARTKEELPVLVEWVTGVIPPPAEFIHLILYNKEQLRKEHDPIDSKWGIVSISTSASIEIEPMRPITAMRNALGVKEGGSGIPIDRLAYQRSVSYWSRHIMVREHTARISKSCQPNEENT